MSGFPFRFAMSGTFFMSAASISVMKQFDIGGINLAQCSQMKSARRGSVRLKIIQAENGISMRFL
jgi:hypothetical protein